MTPEHSPYAVLDELAGHPRGDDLARVVHTAAFAAADERRTTLEGGLAELVDRAGLSVADAETRFGNVVRALERGTSEGAGSATRVLLATLLARGVVSRRPTGPRRRGRVAEALVWLATYTSVDALTALDAALGERAAGLWRSIAALVRRADQGALPQLGRAGRDHRRGGAAGSTSPEARAEAAALVDDVRDPIVRSLLRDALARQAAEPRAERQRGRAGGRRGRRGREVGAGARGRGDGAARGRAVTAAARAGGARAAGGDGDPARDARPPARRAVPSAVPPARRAGGRPEGRDRPEPDRAVRPDVAGAGDVHPGRGAPPGDARGALPAARPLRRARRAGAGDVPGVSLLVDGARAGSPELLGMGALVFAFGAALDFGLSHLETATRGRCRVVLVPLKGPGSRSRGSSATLRTSRWASCRAPETWPHRAASR